MLTLLALAVNFSVVEMTMVFFTVQRRHSSFIANAVWLAGFTVLALLFATGSPGAWPRKWWLAGMIILWSICRTCQLYRRRTAGVFRSESPLPPDRPIEVQEASCESRRFWELQMLGLAQVVISSPLVVAGENRQPGAGPFEWAGFIIWAMGIVLGTETHPRFARFQPSPPIRDETRREGLWQFSRYSEIWVWAGCWLFACGSPWGWITVCSPLLVLWFSIHSRRMN